MCRDRVNHGPVGHVCHVMATRRREGEKKKMIEKGRKREREKVGEVDSREVGDG